MHMHQSTCYCILWHHLLRHKTFYGIAPRRLSLNSKPPEQDALPKNFRLKTYKIVLIFMTTLLALMIVTLLTRNRGDRVQVNLTAITMHVNIFVCGQWPNDLVITCSGHFVNLLLGCTFGLNPDRRPRTSPGLV